MSPTEQRTMALELANRMRVARANDKRDLRRRRLKVSDIIEDPAPHWRSMLLYEVMLLAPWFDSRRLRAFNAKAIRYRINAVGTLDGLDDGERAFVVDYLRERGL